MSRRPLALRGVVAEGLLALLGGLLLTCLLKRGALRSPASTVSTDTADPLLQTWQLAWVGHAVKTQPSSLFEANIFAPLARPLAYSDSLLGYAPLGLIGSGPDAALVRYNVAFVLAHALAFAGTYLLARQLGSSRGAAAFAGVAYAFNPWRIAQSGHLNILSTGGIPLALAMLARGHAIGRRRDGERPPVRPGWALAGWVTACWQLSLGFGIGLQFAYLLGLLTLIGLTRLALRKVAVPVPLLRADALGVALFLATGLALSAPYNAVVEQFPESRRDLPTVALYSPPLRGFVTAPAESASWGEVTQGLREGLPFAPENTLAPGLAVTVLGALGLLWGRAPARRRIALGVTVGVCVLLALGTMGPAGGRFTYVPVFEHLPGWQGVRTPGRLVTTGWLALGLLAATGIDRLRTLVGSPQLGLALAVGLTGVAVLEGRDTLAYPAPTPPPAGLDLATVRQPLLLLPTSEYQDNTFMWWSTQGFPEIANGSSGFLPGRVDAMRKATTTFPSPEAVAVLRAYGVRSVVLVHALLPGSAYEAALTPPPVEIGGVTRQQRGNVTVYDLGG
ncbi:MAG: hypothetical protein JWN57_1961 [Frankiales bacterium]|jgi:hypothetical protein|nr:hypothetical protein [Frankiales bacterium]